MESLAIAACFGGIYRGRRVLVTGHTGFKGSWLVAWLRALGAEVAGLALPPDTTPNHWQLLALDVPNIEADICLRADVDAALARFQPEIVFHLAAQALVRRSYGEPVSTVATNVMGLINVLEAARAQPSVRAVVNATTDKCYDNDGRHGLGQGYTESDPLGGADPYSASKACAEIISAAWQHSFFNQREPRLLLATARAGNVIGGGDWAEDRLVPDLVRAALAQQVASIRHPQATRPWQHVLEPLSGYLLLGARLLSGDQRAARAWNFGPKANGHLSVGELCQLMHAQWPALRYEVESTPNAPHEARHLALDCSAARRELGWQAVWDAKQTVARTAQWYAHHAQFSSTNAANSGALHGAGNPVINVSTSAAADAFAEHTAAALTAADLLTYVADAKRAGLEWAQ